MKYYVYLDSDARCYVTSHEEYVVGGHEEEPHFYHEKDMVFDSEDIAKKFCFLLNRIKKLERKFELKFPSIRENY